MAPERPPADRRGPAARGRGRPPYPDILTPAEWRVLDLLREGLSNPEIAERLALSRDTVKTHVGAILSKLGVATREEAATWQPEAAQTGRPPREPQLRRRWAGVVVWLRPVTVGKAALITAAVAVVAGMGVLAWGSVRLAQDSQGFDLPDSYEQMLREGNVLYLAPVDQALWIADESPIETAEIRVVSSVPDLEAAASGDTAAVIIDREQAEGINAEWASGLLDRGVVIAAARMNVFDVPGVEPVEIPVDLEGATRDNFDFFDESRILFTLYERESAGCDPGGGSGEGGAQDFLDRRPAEDFRFFLVLLAKHHANAQCDDASS